MSAWSYENEFVNYIYRSWDGSKIVEEHLAWPTEDTIGKGGAVEFGIQYHVLDYAGGNPGFNYWYYVDRSMTISQRLYVNSGTVNIILFDGITLTLDQGITVGPDATLNIFGQENDTGKIYSNTGVKDKDIQGYAIIGGGSNPDTGNINIYGGTLELYNGDAIWGYKGACIGGGQYGSPKSIAVYGGNLKLTSIGGACIGGGQHGDAVRDSTQSIRIYGGEINADSWWHGAAIGCGEKLSSPKGAIAIYGGTHFVTGHNGNAGIGGGTESTNPTIDIYGGRVTANGVDSKYTGAGIGSGRGTNQTAPIRLHDGIVIATGQSGAGVGAGCYGNAKNIEITGATVIASSTAGAAGIGGGKRVDKKGGHGGNISISNGSNVVATSSNYGQAQDFINQMDGYISNTKMKTDDSAYAAGIVSLVSFLVDLFDDDLSGTGIGGGYNGSAGTITISDSVVTAASGDYAAAIGTGDEASGNCTINITNGSDVTAKAGTDAAGIGTGNENSSAPTINISDSTVTAHGGRYGAGIGGGDDVSGGTITISNSVVTADSKTDAAGIGGGEDGKGGTITIKDNSNVTATGGGYGAGIGGGDHADGGNITIDGSTVKAYGGTDGAGIGGGEDGDGGHIEIYDSNVYAEGKSYGAGIGGGEDGNGDFCGIYGNSTVEAVSGGAGNVQSIGHGDCGWYVFSYSGGTLSLGSSIIVMAGSNSGNTTTYYGDDRHNAVWNNKYAKLLPCMHNRGEYRCESIGYHAYYCLDCGERARGSEAHVWDDNNNCKLCGASAAKYHAAFTETDSAGNSITREFEVPINVSFVAPECNNIPQGYAFEGWKSENGYTYFPNDNIYIREDCSFRAIYYKLVEAEYIDDAGNPNSVTAKQLIDCTDGLFLTGGWYIVDENLNFNRKNLKYNGSINLIIADGRTVSFEPGTIAGEPGYDFSAFFPFLSNNWGDNPTTFSIYGQSKQTGVLNVGNRFPVVQHFKMSGGTLNLSQQDTLICDFRATKTSVINGGTIRGGRLLCEDGIVIKGGNIDIEELIFDDEHSINLGWKNLSDSFKVDTISEYSRCKVVIEDNQAFKDEDGNIYRGTLTTEQIYAMQGKTLTPCILHDYAEPEWVWANEYKDATAVFRCRDCDDVQEVKAKVTTEDNGKNRTATARCVFNGLEYSTTQTFQILFDITIADCAHGSVTADKVTAKAGNNVKLDITPDDGYVLSALYYTDVNENKTEIEGKSFTMPESDVTISAGFAPIISAKEPYIDESGEYHLGNIEYVEVDGEPFSVTEDGTIGEKLDDVSLSYFDFRLRSDDTYQIAYYTGPKIDGELVIPKTFSGKKITVLGNNDNKRLYETDKTQFSLVLNENITEIRPYTFYVLYVTEVKGDTSALKTLYPYAFSWANSPGDYKIDLNLDYPGEITVNNGAFNNMNVTAHLKHSTKLSSTASAQSMTYDFTDAHPYGDPTWSWAEDYSSAAATFTCTDERCNHQETVDATVTGDKQAGKITYTATAEMNGKTYTDTKEADRKYFAGHSESERRHRRELLSGSDRAGDCGRRKS